MSVKRSTVTGRLPMELANAVSDAINAALRKGMETDEAACVAASVAADYARLEYGNAYLTELAKIIVARADEPAPEDIANPAAGAKS